MERIQLRPYQEEAVASVIQNMRETWRQIVVIATGGGKTAVISTLIDKMLRPGGRALVLAHREELLTQAKAEIEEIVPDLLVELEQAQNKATREHHLFSSSQRHVVVGSVQTLRGKRLQSWSYDSFDLILIDESHHAAAKSYIDIITHFGCMNELQRTPLIGVTATPNRSDGVGLGVVFQKIASVYAIRELVELGFLCGIRAINVKSHTDISRVKISAGDFAAKELETAVDDDERNALIVASYKKFAPNRPAVAFTAGVEHARHLAQCFIDSGIPAEAVWGAMGSDERKSALRRFKLGETQILTNHSILTEGFNEPKVSCIILGRPSKSSLVITQQIGRGTRLFRGKDDCLVIDVKDVTNGKSIVSVPSLAGLPSNFDAEGKDIFKAAKSFEKIDPRLASKITSSTNLNATLAKLENGMSVIEIDLMAATAIDPFVEAHSDYLWSARTDSMYEISPNKGEAVYRIAADTLGKWHVTSRDASGNEKQFGTADDIAEAFKIADGIVQSSTTNTALIERKAKWRGDAPSFKQIATLERLRAKFPADITKGQACALISSLIGGSNR